MLNRFFAELSRRKVIRSVAIYGGMTLGALEVISAVFPMLNLSPVYQTLAAVVLLGGFPVVCYLAWFYEFSDGGWQRIAAADADVDTEPAALGLWHWLGLLLIVASSLAVSWWLYQRIATDLQKEQEGTAAVELAPTIAVLPFRDQSPDQDQLHFAEGVAEELTSLLGQRHGLQVAASSSSFIAAKRQMDPVQLGKTLAVASVLSGSIVVTGDRLKLRVELVNTADGKVLWTQSFSRQLTDMFAVQEEIARSVANLLQDVYLETGAVKTSNRTASSDAYVLYLKGREQYRKQTTEAMKQARQLFEQALGLDPEYAAAYVGLADSIVLLAKGKSRLGILEPEIASQLAEQNLAKALTRAPELAEAYAIQGKVLELKLQDENALPMYDKAIALNPSLAIAHMWRYIVLDRLNRKIEAMESLEKALALDPLSVTLMFNHGFELSLRGRFGEARTQFEGLIEQFPESPMGHYGLADAAYQNGELALSLREWKRTLELSPDNHNYLQGYISVLLMLGFLEEAKPLATDPFYTATFLLLGGDHAGLFRHMDFELQARPDDPWLMFEAGWYDYLVGDPVRGRERLVAAYGRIEAGALASPSAVIPACSPAIELAYALRQSQRGSEAEALISRCSELLRAARQQGLISMNLDYLAARLAALNGDKSMALTELEQAVARGWREWWTRQDPVLTEIRAEPRAQVAFAAIDTGLASEREKARQLLEKR